MSDIEANISHSNGFLFIQSKAAFDRESQHQPFEPLPSNMTHSYAVNGWYRITKAIRIKDEVLIKIEATHLDTRVDARFQFDLVTKSRREDNGHYEIHGGQHAGNGTFINIVPRQRDDVYFSARDNSEFTYFFMCQSNGSRHSPPFLMWRIVLREFSSSDTNAT